MKKLVVSVVSAAALATAGMAAANHSMAASDQSFSSNNSARGIYVSGNVGAGFVGIKKSDYGFNVTKLRDYGFAWAANLGYQFNKYLALEAGYMNMGQTKATVVESDFTGTITNTLGGFDAAVKGILPVSSQFDLYGKVGTVDMHDDVDISASGQSMRKNKSIWVPMIGVGTAYNLTHHVALTVEDDYAFRVDYKHGDDFSPSVNTVLAGMIYKFNV